MNNVHPAFAAVISTMAPPALPMGLPVIRIAAADPASVYASCNHSNARPLACGGFKCMDCGTVTEERAS